MIDDGFGPKIIWLTSTASFCLVLTLISCLCGCRKKTPKNELLGLAGLVKITNPDENVNFDSGSKNVQLNSITVVSDDPPERAETHDPAKRGSNALATATRSLPDLPVDSGEASEKLWGPSENNADTNSDLYATVEDANRKKRQLTSGLTVDSYTPSQTDDSLSPYARLKGEHPYDQLQQNEHPYAQVGPNGHISPTGPSTSQDTNNTTPSRREEEDNKSTTSEIVDEIPAASAIAGSVPANHDLPYMTPPIPNQSQQHFSGDSVDSSKGYTSISVREPLSRIMASSRRNGADPHYATVSDDSDEMYAAIEERGLLNRVTLQSYDPSGGGEYTSGSETYAQIAPPSHPPNLSLNLQHQDSVSSSGSAESPRRERRVANSPLPQVPALDEMYAKVNKKNRSPTSPEPPDDPNLSTPGRSDLQNVPGYETLTPSDRGFTSDPNYEELQPQNSQEPDYASLSRRYESSDPNYESVGSSLDPPYERVNSLPPLPEDPPDYEVVCSRPGQQSLHSPESLTDLYARVNKSPEKRHSTHN